MKTANTYVDYPIKQIEQYACPELTLVLYIRSKKYIYECDRSHQTYCDGQGWCPLRYKESWHTPKMRSDGSGWRHY